MAKYKPLPGDIVMLKSIGGLTEKINSSDTLEKLKDYQRIGKRFVYKPNKNKLLCGIKFLYSEDTFKVAKDDIRGVY